MARNQLHELIRSLNGSQKRYFKVYCSSSNTGRDRNYLRLFDVLEKMSVYDERVLKSKLADSPILKNLGSAKTYLFELLLKAMRNYSGQESAFVRLHSMMQDIEFLYRQRLIKSCRKRIKKARKIAEQFELYGIALGLIDYELAMLPLFDGDKEDELKRIEKEHSHYFGRYQQLVALQQMSRGTFLAAKKPDFPAVYERYQSSIRQNGYDQDMTFYMRTRLLGAEQYYHRFYEDHERVIEIQGEILEEWHRRPDFINERLRYYQGTLNMYQSSALILHRYEEAEKVREKIISLPLSNVRDRYTLWRMLTVTQLYHYNNSGDVERLREYLPTVEEELEAHRNQFSAQDIFVLQFNLFLSAFIMEDWEVALGRSNHILGLGFAKQHEYRKVTGWLNAICLLEIYGPALAQPAIEAQVRYIRKYRSGSEIDQVIGKFMMAIVKSAALDFRDQCIAALARLGQIDAAEISRAGDEVRFWLLSKTTGDSIAKLIRRELNKPSEAEL